MAQVARELDASKDDISRVRRGRALEFERHGARVRVEITAWTEHGHGGFSAVEVTLSNTEVPEWFYFNFADRACSISLGELKLMDMEAPLVRCMISSAGERRLGWLRSSGRISRKRASLSWQRSAPIAGTWPNFVREAVDFVHVVEDMADTLPDTQWELECALAENAQDPVALKALLKRLIGRMERDAHAAYVVHQFVAQGRSPEVLLSLYGFDPHVDILIHQASRDTQRTLALLQAAMSLKGMKPARRQRLVGELVSELPVEAMSATHAKAYPRAMYPLLKHHWESGAPAEEVVDRADAMIPFIGGTDAVEWLLALSKEHPELCDYERMGAALKHKHPPTQRARLLEVLARVFDAQPELVRQPRWLERTLMLLASGTAPQARRLAPLLLEQLNVSHLSYLRKVAQDPALQGHPIQAAIAPTLEALLPHAAAGGSLSLVDVTSEQAGELTSVAEQGALSSSKG